VWFTPQATLKPAVPTSQLANEQTRRSTGHCASQACCGARVPTANYAPLRSRGPALEQWGGGEEKPTTGVMRPYGGGPGEPLVPPAGCRGSAPAGDCRTNTSDQAGTPGQARLLRTPGRGIRGTVERRSRQGRWSRNGKECKLALRREVISHFSSLGIQWSPVKLITSTLPNRTSLNPLRDDELALCQRVPTCTRR
jgi:hypothetical protein